MVRFSTLFGIGTKLTILVACLLKRYTHCIYYSTVLNYLHSVGRNNTVTHNKKPTLVPGKLLQLTGKLVLFVVETFDKFERFIIHTQNIALFSPVFNTHTHVITN